MSRDPALPFQAALVAALRGDSAVADLVGARIFDEVPQQAVFPYVAIGEMQGLVFRADQYRGTDEVVTLHAWSRSVGSVEVRQILTALREALDGAALSVTGFRLVSLLVDESRSFLDQDGKTHHGVLTFRALLEPAT